MATVSAAVPGASWQVVGIQLALVVPVMLGVPMALAVDHLLRPRASRSPSASLHVAVVVAALEFCALWVAIFFEPWSGVAFGVAAGALASMVLARRQRAATRA